MDNVVKLYKAEAARVNAAQERMTGIIMQAVIEYNQTMMEASTKLLETMNQASIEFQKAQIPPSKE